MSRPVQRTNRLADPESLGFSKSVLLSGPHRSLHIGGQVPALADGSVPERFADQARLAWQKIFGELAAAGMERTDLMKVTIFLADRADAAENRAERLAALGGACPALTVVIAELLDPRWKIEIEATACA